MKRHRVLGFDFDTRARTIEPIPDHWEEAVKEQHRQNQARAIEALRDEFGARGFDQKLQNFGDLGAKPFSVIAFHNRFYQQSRSAFVQSQYYPALTGVTALGERVLNHLVLGLRDQFKTSRMYKHVYRKESFDNWQVALDALNEWNVLTPAANDNFRALWQRRNDAVHFNPDTEANDRALALEALLNFGRIIEAQFAALGDLPWLFMSPGEIYVKREWEQNPFVRLVYIPNTFRVGFKHRIVRMFPWQVEDAEDYEDGEISDAEFVGRREAHKNAG